MSCPCCDSNEAKKSGSKIEENEESEDCLLKCPKCGDVTRVGHVDGSALVCQGCKSEVEQADWIRVTDKE